MRGINSGDKWLNEWLIKVLNYISQQLQASIPSTCQDWHETKAVYCLFDKFNRLYMLVVYISPRGFQLG